MSRVQLIDGGLFDATLARARQSPRGRTNHNFHRELSENPHRFLNVMSRGTYVTPHRHLEPPKSETFVILRGEVAFFTFDDDGDLERAVTLGAPEGPHPCGIDLEPGIWHSLAVLSEDVICFEVKPGPYMAATDKDFAPWAPREGDPRAPTYLAELLERHRAFARQPAPSR